MSLFIDQIGNILTIDKTPERIISLVPSQTELLYDLGLEEKVVGITKFCTRPAHWKKTKKIIGGTKKFNFEAIENLSPDLIIGNKEENYQEGITHLKQKFPVWMSDIYTLDDALKMIAQIGEITHTKEKANNIIKNISDGFNNLNIKNKKSVAYFIWKDPYMVVAKNTFIDDMLKKSGFTNVFSHLERYPEITLEDIKIVKPNVILLSTEPYPFSEKNTNDFRNLFPESFVHLADAEMFSWYGSRLQHSAAYIQNLIREIHK